MLLVLKELSFLLQRFVHVVGCRAEEEDGSCPGELQTVNSMVLAGFEIPRKITNHHLCLILDS